MNKISEQVGGHYKIVGQSKGVNNLEKDGQK
jgi:hypothetical protein